MIYWISMVFIISPILEVYSQYEQVRAQYYTPAPVAILMHKQALGHDGSFNYAFSAENGLQQGEVINPDGSRTGSYSYVDPNGKTISLKYTAGKDGFRVLEGDHIPRPPPLPVPVQPANNYYQPLQPQPQPQPHPQPYDGRYRGNAYGYEPIYRSTANYKPPILAYSRPQYSVDEGNEERRSYSEHQYRTPQAPVAYSSSSEEEPVHTGPHTFGSGYSFEFSG